MTNLRKEVRLRCLEYDISLARVVRVAQLDYDRIERVLHGRVKPRPGEIDRIFAAIDRVAGSTNCPVAGA